MHRGGKGSRSALKSEAGDSPAPYIMLIFSYGTLTLPMIRDRVLGHPVQSEPAVLRGYRKICGWDYLTVIPSDGSVDGVVFEADSEDILRMDTWEEVPTYSLVGVRVETDSGPRNAFAYIMPEPPEHYEFVDDGRIAAIPILDIMRDLERLMG